MSKPGIVPDSGMTKRPSSRDISMRSAVIHLAGSEVAYPTYQFSSRIFSERPNWNPFSGIVADVDLPLSFSAGFDEGFY